MSQMKCGARKPGWESGPEIGRHRIPCIRPEGHQGTHRDALGQQWANARTREEYEAQWAADDAALCREAEWKRIARTLENLYAAAAAGDNTEYTRQRIARWEALQSCLLGSPEVLAA